MADITGAVNTLNPLAPILSESTVQMFLNNKLTARKICTVKSERDLPYGDTIDQSFVNSPRVQTYTPSQDPTFDGTVAVNDPISINRAKVVTYNFDPVETKQSKVKDLEAVMQVQGGHEIAREVDQYMYNTMVNNADNTISSSALTMNGGNISGYLADFKSILAEEGMNGGGAFVALPSHLLSALSEAQKNMGFTTADRSLINGFVGSTAEGLEVYESNDLPSQVSLDLTTNPTNGQTIKLKGVTWTFVTNGTAAAAGEISIGANAAATQAIVVNAYNGTGTPGASTYIELSSDDRNRLRNAQISCGAFSSSVAILTGYGRLRATDSLAEGFTQEKMSLVAGKIGAATLGMQMEPRIITKPGGGASTDYQILQLYGGGVHVRAKRMLVSQSVNLPVS